MSVRCDELNNNNIFHCTSSTVLQINVIYQSLNKIIEVIMSILHKKITLKACYEISVSDRYSVKENCITQ